MSALFLYLYLVDGRYVAILYFEAAQLFLLTRFFLSPCFRPFMPFSLRPA